MGDFADSRPGYENFGTSVGEMKAAIENGYFTLAPNRDISGSNFRVFMEQKGAGGDSEIIIYKWAFGENSRSFVEKLFHEFIHVPSWQDGITMLEGGWKNIISYDSDPKSYYDSANTHLTVPIDVPSDKGGAPIPKNYEGGHLYEGNVNNWYPREILRDLRLW